MASIAHLASRFIGALSPAAPSPGDEAWALEQLGAGERELWRRMSNPDRRHAIGVARRVTLALGPGASTPVVAAALLHDVGKIGSGLGTFGRVGATIWASVLGRDRASRGRGAVARYLRHDEIGAHLLIGAGSDPLTVAWAREHHRAGAEWSIAIPLGQALKDADDD